MTGFGSSCGACKFLRRKCSSECIFAPYFCYDEAPSHFSAVHKVFGASNVSKLLLHLPVHNRSDAATTISYEALARMRDPVYGCVAHIFALQQQIACLQEEIEILGNQIANNLTAVISSCESSEPITNNNGSNVNGITQISSQNDVVMNSQYYQNQQEILLSQIGNSTGNNINSSQGFEYGQMGAQFPPLYGWDHEEKYVPCHSFSDPLGKLFDGVQQDNVGNSSAWLDDDIPVMESCIGPIWD